MKKLSAILVAVALLVSCVTAFGVYAAESDKTELSVGVYPESEHNYQNDFWHTWTYTHPTEAEGLFVTFSEETSLDEEYHYVDYEDGGQSIYYDEIFFYSASRYDEWDDFTSWRGNELSGKTVYIPGNSFRIVLSTDFEGTAYGFSIDSISDTPPEGVDFVRYHLSDSEKVDFYDAKVTDETIVKNTDATRKPGYAFCGWSDTVGGEAKYFAWDTIEAEGSVDLYAVWKKLIIDAEDAFSFSNSDIGYTPPADNDYYMTDEHYDMMLANFFKTFGLGPIPGPIAAAVLSTYPSWEFTGSCYGMAASVFLNYYDAAEFIPATGAENLSEIRLTGDVISMVNYYQAQAASSYLCENIAPKPGTAVYSENLKNVYETVESGKPVLLTYYWEDYLIDMGHAVTLTGAFEDEYGNKYLAGYDSNYDYVNGACCYFRISPDYTELRDCYAQPQRGGGYMLTGFNWTADYEQFTAFDINGEGNPLVWYKIFFGHIVYWMQTVFSAAFGA